MSELRTLSPGPGYSRHVHMCQHLLALLTVCHVISTTAVFALDMVHVVKLTGNGPGGSLRLQRARPCSIKFPRYVGLRHVQMNLQ